MKNDMKLIMESWRSKTTLMERDAHSNEWISQINVSQFLEALKEENNDVLNSKVIERALSGAMKKYANEIAELEGEQRKKLDTLIAKVSSEGSADYIADAAVELSGEALKTGLTTAVVGGAVVLGAPVAAAAVGSALLLWAGKKLIKSTAKKGIKIATDIGGALEDLDVPDQDVANDDALNLIDISDEYKKVIIGADGKLDKKEAAVLAIGFKGVARAFNEINEKIATIDSMPSGTIQEIAAQSDALNDLLDEPMTAYMSNTATEAARKAYGKMLDLKRNVTINKN